jgi:hypothetical protein
MGSGAFCFTQLALQESAKTFDLKFIVELRRKMTEFEDPRVEELDSDDEVVESKVAVPDEDEVTNISQHQAT